MSETINLNLQVWKQSSEKDDGAFEYYSVKDVSIHISFLEMLDVVNENLQKEGKEPIAFDSDCREGICGTCGFVIDGVAHGPMAKTTVCQLHMRHFEDGQTLVIEPFRATPFKVVKDLVVDRSSFDSIIQAGGYISVSTGNAPDANNILISKDDAENAFDSAACIGCGACVASCPNASAALFTSAKISHLSFLPQGKVEGDERVKSMVDTMDSEGFGACSNHGECEAVCPKGISISNIALMRKNLIKTIL
ncbi:MAG: succinate dehydrogenase/fumarate reductase iron-sulfur subunit [Thermodesulfobacteriota bacteirum]|jgi:succinate dehydrogenase / fumarate reductase, iron-sulfur subunit|nr:succinate dehydrogenase/fumarate reductase iron-sulfur subunit [Thermodesulfobacteriota bacterium]NSW99529.1 succinate dehydrogenase/fumarate reductase iron-sulfur subunit [bacterium]|tara:strand:+ start:2356 stop:3105 length:750 start_codon:yes stop_codon:yes gene_type:complete